MSVYGLANELADGGVVEKDKLAAVFDDRDFDANLDLLQELISRNLLTGYQAFLITHHGVQAVLLGRYIILDRIGRGGFGEVFAARHKAMGRVVAVKTITDESTIGRFRREMKLAGLPQHPNIVTVHDADLESVRPFLVMEYVEGVDLQKKIDADGALDLTLAIDITAQVARGLECAHRHSIIHRDIKPRNVMLTSDNVAKILDFGLARKTSNGSDSNLTVTGAVMGTANYMAPEQAENPKLVDHRADIYSLGCTFYYLLKGEPPYEGESTVQTIIAHREQPIPRLPEEVARSHPEINAIYMRMLAKSPDDRFQSVSEVAESLLVSTRAADSPRFSESPTNSIGMSFNAVSAGKFTMGSNYDVATTIGDLGFPAHEVELSCGYLLGKMPVTQAQFTKVMKTNPSAHLGAKCPVESVSWFDAIEYANHLSRIENLPEYYTVSDGEVTITGGNGYRLPTEAEWEFACRANTESTWFFGEDEGVLEEFAWTSRNSEGRTHPVGLKRSNGWEIYDLYGNTWEWCWDRYDELYYSDSPKIDPLGPSRGDHRAIRGGSFVHRSKCCSSSRSGLLASDRTAHVGFRLARNVV